MRATRVEVQAGINMNKVVCQRRHLHAKVMFLDPFLDRQPILLHPTKSLRWALRVARFAAVVPLNTWLHVVPQESLKTAQLSEMAEKGWKQLKLMRRLFQESFDNLSGGGATLQRKHELERNIALQGDVDRQELRITPKPLRLMSRLYKYV